MHILSVNVGVSREVTIKHLAVQTGLYKMPTSGPVHVSRLGLQADVRVEPRKMGLEHSAVYAYPYEHYAYWQHELGRAAFPMGQFGENLTVSGLLEHEVRIGDIFRFGSAVLQVAHPRIPCAKLNERMGLRFSPMFMASYKVGYYLRVLREGSVAQGDAIELLERDMDSPTVEEFIRVTQYEYWDAQALQRLLQARDLMPGWREIIEAKLERARSASGWHGLREFEVVRREEECADTVSLYLKCVRGRPLAPFHGGQQLTVVLGGRSAHQHRRAYSLSGSPQDVSAYRITVRRMAAPDDTLPEGIVSSQLVAMQVGGHVLCTAPYGVVTRRQEQAGDARIAVLLSQDLGIAPMLSMLYELEAGQARAAFLFHEAGAAEPQGLLREVRALLARNPAFRMIHCAPGGVDAALIRRHVPLAQAAVHLSGSRAFVERLLGELQGSELASAALVVQSFG
jgi:MOSC domain-containing protein YiiM/ferredoxin-NADP reductase